MMAKVRRRAASAEPGRRRSSAVRAARSRGSFHRCTCNVCTFMFSSDQHQLFNARGRRPRRCARRSRPTFSQRCGRLGLRTSRRRLGEVVGRLTQGQLHVSLADEGELVSATSIRLAAALPARLQGDQQRLQRVPRSRRSRAPRSARADHACVSAVRSCDRTTAGGVLARKKSPRVIPSAWTRRSRDEIEGEA